ncbi:hypothetical protein [Myxosarcina sp. GI1(2024)]
MTPKELKDLIIEAIPDQLGTYTYPNGHTDRAIAIGNPPNNLKVSGVEVIIPNFPTTENNYLYGDTYFHRCEKWKVAIVNHGNDKGNWFTAIDRLHRFFHRSYGNDVPQSDPLKTLPMYVLTIRADGISERI